MRTVSLLILTFGLLGCGSMTMMERSPDYEAGYADGCGNAALQMPGIMFTPKRNEMTYAASEDYRRGWNSGNVQCRQQRPNGL
jgi:hypothetical protein